jgi:hypothetical protein
VGLLIVATLAALYWCTAARDIVVGDTPELVTAAITLGVAHPPGYPLFTILGHLFSFLPFGTLPFRVNLLSLACNSAAVGFVQATARRLTGAGPPAAAAALVLGLSTLFWEWSLAAEVFSLNNLLAAALIYFLVRWRDEPGRGVWVAAAALTTGLALSNQLTIVLLAPAVLTVLWSRRAALSARAALLLGCALAILVGLLPYAYIPWAAARRPMLNWGAVASPGELVDFVLRRAYGTAELVAGPYAGGSATARVLALLASIGPLTGTLALAGAVRAYRSVRWYFWFCLLAFLFAGPLFIAYANMDISRPQALYVLERFFLLSRVAVAPLVAFGILSLAGGLRWVWPRLGARAVPAVATAVVALAGAAAVLRYPAVNQSENRIARHFAEDILATLEPGSILLASGDHVVLPLIYLQAVERRRPDVTVVMLPLMSAAWYVSELRRRHPDLALPAARHTTGAATMRALVAGNRGRPIALMGDVLDPSLKGAFWFYRYGLVYRILPIDRDVRLSEMVRDNESLLARYRVPSTETIKSKSFEYGVLVDYAAAALKVAQECEKAGRTAEARAWYERALAMAPDLILARDGLRRLGARQPGAHGES